MSFFSFFGLPIALAGGIILGLSLLQLNQNLSPFPSPRSGSQLVTNGLYAFMRHPIYTGILGLTLGWSLYSQDATKLGVSIALLLLFYFKSTYEEKLLVEKFGETYQNYQSTTRRFL